MKTKIAVALIFVLLSASVPAAERSATFDGGVVVTLYDTPCSNEKVLAMLKPEFRSQFQQGQAVFPNRTIELCWNASLQPGAIVIADEEGDVGAVPLSAFATQSKDGI